MKSSYTLKLYLPKKVWYQEKNPTIRLGSILSGKWIRLIFNAQLILFSQVPSENKKIKGVF